MAFLTYTLTGTSPDITLVNPMVAQFLVHMGVMHSNAEKHIFQGTGDVSFTCENIKDDLQKFVNPGEAPQHKEVGPLKLEVP